jgi:energy-coupling factor transporter ATP-binding protein EcfA2
MSSGVTLADVVSVRGRFVRSAHLERDYRKRQSGSYHLTETAYQVLKAVETAFEQSAQRAITLTGPYGAGKSAFCIHLAGLLEQHADYVDAANTLAKLDPGLHSLLRERRLIPILLVGSRQPLARALVVGLLQSLEQGGYSSIVKRLCTAASAALEVSEPTARQVADLYRQAADIAKNEQLGGVLLIIDEMGKFLEHSALYPKQSDIFALQELAEAAARSGDAPLLILAVLHQNVEAYSQKLGRTHQAEWAKIGERFRQINFFPSDGERMELVGRALKQESHLRLTDGFIALCRSCLDHDIVTAGLKSGFVDRACAAYPLHPICLLALPALFRRTGQSHRSMFNFLAGEEPHALGRFLRETPFDSMAPPLFMLDTLFDYAGETHTGGWGGSSAAKLWLEAVEIVNRAANIGSGARQVLKCIGLLSILRDPKLHANRETLQLALTNSQGYHPDVQAALGELLERRLIVYSRTRQRYRLWEGGDVDIEEELNKAKTSLQIGTTLYVATQLCPPTRLIARRHSYRTGTLRTVQVQTCDASQLETVVAQMQAQLTTILCLASTAEEVDRAEQVARMVALPNLLIAVATETEILRETASDVAAAHRVAKENPELPGDAAARRELAGRIFEAETAFQAEWERLFGAGQRDTLWIYQQETREFNTPKEFSTFLSYMADRSYEAAPILRNELINRRTISAAAAAGRRALIEAMLTAPAEPRLGLKGYPPEVSMYECLIHATGLHCEVAPGQWGWSEPDHKNPASLRLVWDALAARLFAGPPAPLSAASLFAELNAPPYGLTEGVLPVLLCAFLQVYADETTLYREGSFLPEPCVADWEVLLRRPEIFAVAGCRVVGDRAIVVRRLAQGLKTDPTVIAVVRALLKMVRSLPEQAWKTRKLPPEILALRAAFEKARSPERLLFHDLPAAIGATLFAEEEVSAANVEAFFFGLNAALRTWSQVNAEVVAAARDTLLEACGLPTGDTGWHELRQQAAGLANQVLQPTLLPFLHRAAAPGDSQTVLESVLAVVANRPSRSWTDLDAERFPSQARVIGSLLQQARLDKPRPHPDPVPALPDAETEQCRQLVSKLKSQFSNALSKQVRRAALLALLQEIDAATD